MPLEHERDAVPFLAEPGALTHPCDEGSASPSVPKQRLHHRTLSTAAADLVAERFRTLGEPLRVRIIQELQSGERSVSEIAEAVGSSQPNVSKHLRIIQNAGIAGRRHDGNLVYYFITDETVLDLCDAVCSSLGEKLAHDASIADELHGGITRRE